MSMKSQQDEYVAQDGKKRGGRIASRRNIDELQKLHKLCVDAVKSGPLQLADLKGLCKNAKNNKQALVTNHVHIIDLN